MEKGEIDWETLTNLWLELFDMLDELVSVIDEDFNIVKANTRMKEVFGAVGEVEGKKCYEIFHSTLSPPPHCQVKALKEGRGDVGEFLEESLGKWIRVKVREIELDGKRHFLHIVEDISKRKDLEHELLRQKAISSGIAENARVIILAFDGKGKVIFSNRMADEVVGKLRRFERFRDLLDLVPEGERSKMLSFFERLNSKGLAETITSLSDRKIWWKGSEIVLNSEKILVLIGNDITEAEKIERELRESEEKYRTLVEKSHDAIYILKDNRLVLVNDMASKITGYTKEELYSMNPFELIHPEDRQRLIESGKRRIRGEKVPESFDARIITKDGRIRYANFSVSLIDYQGEPAILGTVRDYTDQMLMQEKLRRSEEKYRTLVETMDDVVFTLDLKGRLTFLNKRFEDKTGYSVDEMLGKSFIELVPPENREKLLKIFEEGIRTKSPQLVTLEISKKDGSKVPVEVNVTNLFDGEKVVGRIGVARDISERIKMERSIRERTELLRLINKILRHDISNDLFVIAGAVDILESNNEGPKELVATINSALERSVDLIERMRDLEDLILGDGLKPTKVHEVAREVLNEFKVEYGVDGKVEGECIVKADDALKSVFVNLVRNAIVHGKTDKIEIKIKKDGEFCEVRVADFGIGIPSDVRDKIFDEGFFYGESGKTGLGLYIVKKVLERYGGSVSVEENSPRGAVFILRIPV
ncbi:MAG: PAS domain S-box protein [Archaeoglobus sp.]|nr:PAS domain S-box protein [Archaeoglobus sp.]